ncbi:hypothetical protein BRADI_4g30075v3 [Brachypodium distachyon]|uniref:Uncharacterized protein n=1 Tax=Brachypodium distachyon TaxID=15368 RepID=A0A2K2CR89_BRADI|nr:hypothetical protein BRADI_4g30075v3 [Brachypodium distachyon]PNT64546.1 hypothetical protein BRADI_4g30075v3 [Brachypodium distachyon]PNT64547.1 hypothetical protein BRADI_4g30075v3 [Brachypodium distachyon]
MTALWHQNDADVGIGLPRPAPATRSSSREHAPLTHGRSHCVVSACPAIRRRYLLPAAACRNTTGQGFVTIQASWAQRIATRSKLVSYRFHNYTGCKGCTEKSILDCFTLLVLAPPRYLFLTAPANC